MTSPDAITAWFGRPNRSPEAKLRLFCFPYAGSGTSVYHAWTPQLKGVPIELRPVQLPGREIRIKERPARSIEELVKPMAPLIGQMDDLPFAFFGHSMGALVAYELTRELARQNLPLPQHLFASGARPPDERDDDPPLSHLPDDEFIEAVNKRYQGIPPAVLEHRELLDLMIPILRADFTLLEAYEFQEPNREIDVALTAFGGTDDPRVKQNQVEGWSVFTKKQFSCNIFPGDHFFINSVRAKLVQEISQALRLV